MKPKVLSPLPRVSATDKKPFRLHDYHTLCIDYFQQCQKETIKFKGLGFNPPPKPWIKMSKGQPWQQICNYIIFLQRTPSMRSGRQ